MTLDKLFFYSKSRDVDPGKGANEYVKNTEEYIELDYISNWRRILSNFHVAPFKYNGLTFNSIEHVFQAEKIALADPEKAFWFSLESGHEIGQGDGSIAQKNRKLVKLTPQQLEIWNKIKYKIMENAAMEKYSQCEFARKVLKLTNNAQLWHIVSRKQPERFIHLERIRENI